MINDCVTEELRFGTTCYASFTIVYLKTELMIVYGFLLIRKCIEPLFLFFSLFLGHPNSPTTTSHNKVVIMLFVGLVVLKITALTLN